MNIKRRYLAPLLVLFVGLAVTTAYAVIVASRSLTGTVTIQVATPGLSVQDSTCSTDLTTLDFGQLGPALFDTRQIIVCIRNGGNLPFYLIDQPNATSITFSGLPPGISGSWELEPFGPLPVQLLVNQDPRTQLVRLVLDNDGTAAPGSIVFTVSFRGFNTTTG